MNGIQEVSGSIPLSSTKLQRVTQFAWPFFVVIILDHMNVKPYNSLRFAEVVELVDTSVSKTDGLCRAGSIPAFGTICEE